MFHLIQDPDDGDYLLLETVGANTAYIYRAADSEKCWLPLSALSSAVRRRDESPENFRSLKVNFSFNFIYVHRTKAGIFKFTDKHPELFI